MQTKKKFNSKDKCTSIVFLYSEIMDYVEGTFKALLDVSDDIEINVVHWDKGKNTPFHVDDKARINYHNSSSFDTNTLHDMLIEWSPKIIYVSGWMDLSYLKAIIKYKRKKDVTIVAGIDDQWHGNMRQITGALISRLLFKKVFDYLWVCGAPQYHYARMFGFKDHQIISNIYSANTTQFEKSFQNKKNKRFLYLGRFHKRKGLDILIRAYKSLDLAVKKEWPLILVGSGPLINDINIEDEPNIKIRPFLQNEKLIEEVDIGGVMCLPSNFEAWGVVVHELAYKGYPMILSTEVGSGSEFLIEGYNGFSFKSGDYKTLAKIMMEYVNMTEDKFILFSKRSTVLASRIDSQISAYSLLSIMCKK